MSQQPATANQPTSTRDAVFELEGLRRELAAAQLERDGYRQEMFESNRYSAWVTYERQDLHDRLQALEARSVSGSFVDDGQTRDYILFLEAELWKAETKRVASLTYVEYLENLLWNAESKRVAEISC